MPNLKSAARNRKGFTLVELIVVLVILALLLSTTVPGMTQWIAKSKVAQAKIECRACVIAAQTLAVEKYSSNRPEDSVITWISDTGKRSEDITGLAEVSGTVAADKAKGSGSGDGVIFDSDRGYTVTYLKYYYTDAKDVYIEYTYPGDLVAGKDDGSAFPHPGASPAPPRPTPTASPLPPATPAPGNTYPGTSLPVSSNLWPEPIQPNFPESWSSYTVYPTDIFQWKDGSYYVIGKTVNWVNKDMSAQGPSSLFASCSAAKLTGRIIEGDAEFTNQWGQLTSIPLSQGDIYHDTASGAYYVYLNHDCSDGNPARVPNNWYKLPS
jgi:type IV pilus assembly protein PilA